MLNNLHHLNNPQCALGILRCCWELQNYHTFYELTLRCFDDGQGEVLDQIVGSIIGDYAWRQSSLPISLSALGVRQSQEQYEGAFVGSIIASDELVNKTTSRHPSESDTEFGTVQSTFAQSKKHLIKINLLSK